MSIIAEAKHLKAYYITQSYGIERTVKAVDDISIKIKESRVFKKGISQNYCILQASYYFSSSGAKSM